MTLVYLAGAWLLGLLAAAISGAVWWPGVAAIGVAGLAAAALERRPTLALVGFAAAGLFVAGGWRYIDDAPAPAADSIARYNAPAEAANTNNNAAPVRFRALVVDEPEVRGRSQRVRLSVREVLDGGRWEPASGDVLVRLGLYPRHRYGDLLEVEGELETPPSFPDFDYREYLARQGVVSLIDYPSDVRTVATGEGGAAQAALHSARRELGGALARALPEPQAALAQGILLGQRAAIPQDVTDDLNATGLSHLIAISGQNISLVAALIVSALAWLIGRRPAAVVALLAIAAYTPLTGASPTVVRAAIMGGLFVLAQLAGRPGSALTSIVLAAALMTGWEPQVVHDVSFQLSFAAIVGIVYIAPLVQSWGARLLRAEPEGLAGSLVETSALTTGAIAATLPLIALNFERVSLVTPVANLAVVPAFPLILVSSALTAAGGLVWAPLGEIAGWFAWLSLTYMTEAARFFAGLPLASLAIGGFGAGHAAALYLALAGGVWWLSRRQRAWEPVVQPERLPLLPVRPVWALAGGLALAASLTWWAALADAGNGHLSLSVLDVGQGDALLVETPDGRHMLIDGGPSGQALSAALGGELSYWDREIDLVVLTHPQEDHLAGLIDLVDRYDVRQVLASPVAGESAAYREWRAVLEREGVPYRAARAGQWLDLGGGATLRVLGPGPAALASSDPNNASLVLKLSLGEIDMLLTGDVTAGGERALLASGADVEAEVLKVAHHGSATSTTPAFLRAVSPAVAVVSAGEDNPYGHPSPEVLARLGTALVYRTDEDGTVTIATDGERLWVETEE